MTKEQKAKWREVIAKALAAGVTPEDFERMILVHKAEKMID